METSEELIKIDTALDHCAQLKSQLSGTLLCVQQLNSKYNEIDYMASIRSLEAFYSSHGAQKFRSSIDLHQSHDISTNCSTPVNKTRSKKNVILRRIVATKKMKLNSSAPSKRSTPYPTSTPISSSTPKRTIRDVKQNSNTVVVRTLKVQRNLEAIITQLQVMQKMHQRNHKKMLERSLYESCNNSMNCSASPGKLGHMYCMDHSFGNNCSMYDSNTSISICDQSHYASKTNLSASTTSPNKQQQSFNYEKRTLQRIQQSYATPLQKMHKRLRYLNESLVRTC